MFAIEVRAARDSDVEAIAAIYVDAAREGWADFLGESNMDALQPPLARFRAELGVADARQQMLVAERGGRVIGFAVVRASQDEDASGPQLGELDQLFADPVVWGQGVGRKLMTAAIESLRERGFTEATLWVAAANHRPRRIYEVAGWRLDGVARDRQWRGATVRDVRYRNSLWPSAAGPCRALSQTSRRLRQCS